MFRSYRPAINARYSAHQGFPILHLPFSFLEHTFMMIQYAKGLTYLVHEPAGVKTEAVEEHLLTENMHLLYSNQ